MRFESLTTLRFIAASIVVLFHYNREASVSRFLTAGPQMVTFFFVLSGFVLVIAYQKKMQFSYSRFWINRIARICPAYYLALVFSAMLFFLEGQRDWVALCFNTAMIQSWFPGYALTVNTPAWSLCVEAFFYAVFPFAFSFCMKYRNHQKKLIIGALVFWLLSQMAIAALAASDVNKELYLHFPAVHLCSFMLGLVGGIIFINSEGNLSLLSKPLSIPLFATLTVLALEFNVGITMFNLEVPRVVSFYSPLFLLLILSFAGTKRGIPQCLSWKPFVFLGEISYSIYIFQYPVHTICDRFRFEALSDHQHFWFFYLVLLGVSSMVYLLVELPGRSYLRTRLLALFPGIPEKKSMNKTYE